MSVYKPKKSPFWHFDFQFKGTRFHGSTGETRREDAKAIEAAERRKAARAEHYPEPARHTLTLDAAAGVYWDQVARHQPSAATTDYQTANLIRIVGGAIPVADISNAVVADFAAHRRGEESAHSATRRAAARRRRRRERRTRRNDLTEIPEKTFVSPRSVNAEIELLRRILNYAADIYEIPLRRIDWTARKLAEPEPRNRVLSADEQARLIDAAADHLVPLIRFALITGMRLSALTGLDWRMVDLQAREIRIRLKSNRPGGRQLVLPINAAMFSILLEQGPRQSGAVFRRNGRPIKSFRSAWTGARRRAGIADFRWHDHRHTAATRMRRGGADLAAVQATLGHADIASTMRYLAVDQTDRKTALDAAADALDTADTSASPGIVPNRETG
jgi:integrase